MTCCCLTENVLKTGNLFFLSRLLCHHSLTHGPTTHLTVPGVSAIIFVASISEYDQCLYEDCATNRTVSKVNIRNYRHLNEMEETVEGVMKEIVK